jgi:hypothetical protein
MLGQDATVIVPETTDELMRNKIIAAGGNVVVHGKALPDADEHVRSLVSQDPKLVYVPPFDHEDIWEGLSRLFSLFSPEKTKGLLQVTPLSLTSSTSNSTVHVPMPLFAALEAGASSMVLY